MTKFTITQDQIERLQKFSEYIGKLNFLSINDKKLFYLSGNKKLEIFAYGEEGSAGSVQGEIILDLFDEIIDKSTTSNFNITLDDFLIAANKIKDKEILFNLTNDSLTVTGPNTKSKFTRKLFSHKDQAEVTEIRDFIETQLKLPEFSNASKIDIDITNIKENLAHLASLTKVYNMGKLIEISETNLKFADNFGIVSQTLTAKPTTNTVHLHRDLTGLFKHINIITLSSDKKFWFFDLKGLGIRILLVAPTESWMYPSDSEVDSFSPKNTLIKLEINARKFYQVLSDFDSMFNTDWEYSQVTMKTPVDFDVLKELELNWIGTLSEVNTFLPVTILERTDINSNFDFIVPTKALKEIRPFFEKDENSVIYLEYSSIPVGQSHGGGVKLYNNEIEVIIPKMTL